VSVGRLHVITDVDVQSRFSHQELAELACLGGADVVQLRDKTLTREALMEGARGVAATCRRHGVAFIVNDHADIARAVEADGVHVGRGDLAVREARALLGAGAIVGASAGNLDDALEAEADGASYIGLGHIFATGSIGGITHENAAEVLAAGAWGIAVIGAVCTADDPRAATERLRRIVDDARLPN
jgi:thiamine-phosphate pyrophosphorylase